jgi:hypothetical protein
MNFLLPLLNSILDNNTESGGKPTKGYYTNHPGSLLNKRKYSTNNNSKYKIHP